MAQLTTGKSSANVFRNGNRASEGDFGLYFGATSTIFGKAFHKDFNATFMPLVNLKYMYTDNIEYRLGIELNKWSWSESGSIDVEKKSYDLSAKYTEVENNIYPGIAYHFSSENLLDVYVGAEIPLGYKRLTDKTEFDDSLDKTSRFAYHLGLGAFIGIQAYVANLPVAIGVEYGISSMFDFGLKTKSETKSGDNDTQISYTSDFSGQAYDDLAVRTGEVGSQFRFTLTYFFKN
jgi:hypothetical protein